MKICLTFAWGNMPLSGRAAVQENRGAASCGSMQAREGGQLGMKKPQFAVRCKSDAFGVWCQSRASNRLRRGKCHAAHNKSLKFARFAGSDRKPAAQVCGRLAWSLCVKGPVKA